VGRNIKETIRQVQAFQHARATKGKEACPADRQPGGPTLGPGPDLVGRVREVRKP
jgi:peroxiredoxin (alkyl hydroperoxide reductase subunit C)